MQKTLIIFVISLITNSITAQFSVIQDSEGETSFQVFETNLITINAEKTAIGFSIRPKKMLNTQSNYWTITSSANTKKGTADIFRGGEFQFSGKIGATIIFDKTQYQNPSPSGGVNLLYNFAGFEAIYSRHNVFDATKALNDQIDVQTNLGFRVNYGWNFENIKIEKPILNLLGEFTSGISGSVGIKDNTDIINQVEIITSEESYTEGTITRTVSSTDNAFDINAISRSDAFARINFDFGKHLFNRRLLANFHATYAIDEDLEPVLNPSFGLFVTAKGAPLNAIVGIQIQTRDWGNTRNSRKDRWERSSIVLTAGFPFN